MSMRASIARRQAGLTLLEMMGVLAATAALLTGLTYLTQQWMGSVRGSNAAIWHQTLNTAATAYIKDNYAAITATAGAAAPVAISVAMLKAGNYLPAGFASVNSFGQAGCALVIQPVANRLEALVVGEGGTALSEFDAGPMAAEIGSAGGFIYSATNARGAYAGWDVAIAPFTGLSCSGTAATTGRLASMLWFVDGQLAADYLYRSSVPGHPEANTMNTPLVMGAATVQVANTACTTNGAVARDGNGALLSCQLGQWKALGSAYWQDPVANLAALPACNAASVWQTRVVQTPSTGTGPRAYACDGVGWQPLSVDDNGNLSAAGSISVGGKVGVGATTTSAIGGACAVGNVAQTAGGDVLYCDATTLTYRQGAAKSLVARSLQVVGVVTENAGCPNGVADNGRVARDSIGKLLSCENGVWKPPTGTVGGKLGGTYSTWTSGGSCRAINPAIGACGCPSGYSGQISGFGWGWSQWDHIYWSCIKYG